MPVKGFDQVNNNAVVVPTEEEVEAKVSSEVESAKSELSSQMNSTANSVANSVVQNYTYSRSTIDSKVASASGCSSFTVSSSDLPSISSQTPLTETGTDYTIQKFSSVSGRAGVDSIRSMLTSRLTSGVSGNLVTVVQNLVRQAHYHTFGTTTCYCNSVCTCNCNENNDSN